MRETSFPPPAQGTSTLHQSPQSLPLCAPADIVERSLLHGLLSLAGLFIVVVQGLVNGAVAVDQPGASAATPKAAAAPRQCAGPVVTREAFAAWADGLIARHVGQSH